MYAALCAAQTATNQILFAESPIPFYATGAGALGGLPPILGALLLQDRGYNMSVVTGSSMDEVHKHHRHIDMCVHTNTLYDTHNRW
jgi:hypothetical protein